MSNADLEKDAAGWDGENDEKGNEEQANKSTAAEGDLLEPEEDPNRVKGGKDGSIPDSEELSLEEEEGYDDPNKLSS